MQIAVGVDGTGNTNHIDFQIEIVPADGIRLPISGSGEIGTSPFFGQLSVKTIA